MESGAENGRVSSGHLILLIHTLYSWWLAPAVKLIYIYLLWLFFLSIEDPRVLPAGHEAFTFGPMEVPPVLSKCSPGLHSQAYL